MKKIALYFLIFLCMPSQRMFAVVINDFSTNGKPVYSIKTGILNTGDKGVFTASMDGSVKCFTLQGQLVWKADTNGGFIFDMAVGDINKDGIDEVVVASGDGSLYAFNSDGARIWTFSRTLPLYQVTIAVQPSGDARILTGGGEKVLFSLSPTGAKIDSLKTTDVIRNLRSGNIMGSGVIYTCMSTRRTGNNGPTTLFLINPVGLGIQWQKGTSGDAIYSQRFLDLIVADINGDGADEMILSNDASAKGQINVFDKTGTSLFVSPQVFANISYRMNILSFINLGTGLATDNYILGHWGNKILLYQTDGTKKGYIEGPYAFAASYYDPQLKTLFMGSEVSGGDEIMTFDLTSATTWQTKFKTLKSIGKLKEVETNVATMQVQVTNFVKPAYQAAAKNTNVIVDTKPGATFPSINFATNITMSQVITTPSELWCQVTDGRVTYTSTADQLVAQVAAYEAAGTNVVIWAGHGSAFYFPLTTFQRMVAAAPTHLIGFVFAEMEGMDTHTQDVVNQILTPVADLCLANNKLIIFRNKNVFWNGSCYTPFWSNLLLNNKYKSVFVPGMEETNCRTQELSIGGRVGLWQTGFVDRWACRTVTDNVCFDRMFEWGAQQVMTYYLRNQVSAASMGSTLFFTDINGGNNEPAMYNQLTPLYQMLEKGIIQIPNKDQLISMSDLALEMKPLATSSSYLTHGINGDKYNFNAATDNAEMVFNRLDTYWGGTILPTYDFSTYAMNVTQRTLNFLPETPYGLIPIIPYNNRTNPYFKNFITTDGQYFYNAAGTRYSASNYKSVVQTALASSAANLPILVKGDVNWSAVKIDATHIRVTLVDKGYIDPAQRNAEIVLQHVQGVSCVDILSKEVLPIVGGSVLLTVPAGVFRIVDITNLATDTNTITENKLIYTVDNSTLRLWDIDGTRKLSIYSILGTELRNETVTNEYSTSLKKGIYLVMLSGYAPTKIIVN